MTTPTVFELAQQEAEENVWVPTKATRFISRLLGRRFKRMEAASTMQRHRHKRQPKPTAVRVVTQLRSASRRRYISADSALPSKIMRAKRSATGRREFRTDRTPAESKT
jgi:hypothetical protein